MAAEKIKKSKIRKGLHLFVSAIMWIILFAACASKPGFEGSGDLCGLVLDENNQPVKDFVIYCKSASKILVNIRPVITNESGLFVFYDLPSGEYFLSGNKTNYLTISEVPYQFYDRTRIICLQTKSYKTAVLSAEELIRLGQKKDAEKILDSISCETGSREEGLLRLYQFYVEDKEEDKKKIISELKMNEKNNSDFIKSYSLRLEEVLK